MGILDRLLKWFQKPAPTPGKEGFEDLNRRAPLRERESSPEIPAGTLLCREAVLDPDQRVAGYRFQLRESTRGRIRLGSRRIHHVYAEVLIGSLTQSDIPRLLGHRLAFVEVPDSFVGHPCLRRLPPGNTVIVACALRDANGAPQTTELLEHLLALRGAGYRIGLPVTEASRFDAQALQNFDVLLLDGIDFDPIEREQQISSWQHLGKRPALAAVDIASLDDFQYFRALGVRYFHGPFISRREEWKEDDLNPELIEVRPLLEALRRDAPDAEIVTLTKRNPAISLRLLRFANSAASGLERRIESIEQALQVVGRHRLSRWVTLVMLEMHPDNGRSHGALEAALIRARMLELIGEQRGENADALFLVGLLSLVDIVFRVQLAAALDALAVSQDIREAVLEQRGPYHPELALAEAWDSGDVDLIEKASSACGLSPSEAARLHTQALMWALDVRN